MGTARFAACAAAMLTSAMLCGAALTPAGADHGAPYVATGVAVFEPTGEPFAAELYWSGTGVYKLSLDPPGADELPLSFTIPSHEGLNWAAWAWLDICRAGLEIIWPYTGRDTATNGDVLDIVGIQENCQGPAPQPHRYMVLNGMFSGLWRLRLGTGLPWGTEYEARAIDVEPDERAQPYEVNGLGLPEKRSADAIGPGNRILVQAISGDVDLVFEARDGTVTGELRVVEGAIAEIDVPDGDPGRPTEGFDVRAAADDLAIGTYQRS